MAKFIITGGAGFIGSHIVDKLIVKQYEVVVIDNLSTGSVNNFSDVKNLKFYKKDVLNDDIDEIFKFEQPDYVIHLAAHTNVNLSVSNPYNDAYVNILGTIKLLDLCKKYKIKKILFASSAAVYGTPKYLPIDEGHPTSPISPYGISKLTSEKYIEISKVPYIIFRIANAYGPRQKYSNESGVITIFNEAMLNKKKVSIYGDGLQTRDFVYVADVAEIFIKSIEKNIQNEIINISTNQGISLNDLFSIMKEIYNYSYNINYAPKRPGDIENSVLSNKKLLNVLNGVCLTELCNGIRQLKEYNSI